MLNFGVSEGKLLVEDGNQYVGFASYELNYENSNKAKIQKLYVQGLLQFVLFL
jgi:uncharacterized protein YjbK